jgi:hypothetical protein
LNDQLIQTPQLLQTKTHSDGYLAIFIPSIKDGESNLKLLMNEQDYIQCKQGS